jgi:diguanylate cyclase (GGDEF)-like protein
MTSHLNSSIWSERFSRIEYAFQPIVNIHTGVCYGCEALLRNWEGGGISSISRFFDQAYADGALYHVDLALREKAIEKFACLEWKHQVKLFFNLDNRVLDAEDYRAGNTLDILRKFQFPQDAICFEISEKHEIQKADEAVRTLDSYREQGFSIAVDDCGSGFAGLKLLYYTRPNFIKIDRFFIQDIAADPHKRMFVSSLVNLSHLMGAMVIAEGVETGQEYYSCRDIGCDLVQGYLIQKPETDLRKLKNRYDHIRELSRSDRRYRKGRDEKLILHEMTRIDPLPHTCHLTEVFEKFRRHKERTFFPIVNDNGEPLGVINETSFKEYLYTRYGGELLKNPAVNKNIGRFITRHPIADVHTPAEKILEIYSQNENMDGILIVDNMQYIGFLSAHSLLKVLNEKNIVLARDQNPLTQLPGNTLIHEYVSQALQDHRAPYVLVYFDLDYFKPYNDTYGFRNGDRVIMLFAELLKTRTEYSDRFAGHIGGDDFFMGIGGSPLEKSLRLIKEITGRFASDVESFYDPDTIRRGHIVAKDRNGEERAFPLLTASAAVLYLPPDRKRTVSTEEIGKLLTREKKTAKASPEKISVIRLPADPISGSTGNVAPPIRLSDRLRSNRVA